MRHTSNQFITVFDTTVRHPTASVSARPFAAPDRGYRAVIAVGLALAVIEVTTAAGAFARTSKHTAPADQPSYSANFVKLPTGVTIEDVLY
jgi:hypothetical protein